VRTVMAWRLTAVASQVAVVVGVLLLGAGTTRADQQGVLYGLTACCPVQFVSINPATGAATVVSTVGSGTDVFAAAAAVDTANRLLFVAKRSPSRITTINTQTGAALDSPTLAQDIIALAYHSGSGTLFGVTACCSNQLVSINLTTGALTAVGTLAGASDVFATAAAIDAANNHLFLAKRSPPRIVTVNTGTGAASESPMLTEEILSLGFNPAGATLVAVTASAHVVAVNPSTGAFTALSTLSAGPLAAGSDVDASDSLFFLAHRAPPRIVSVNTGTGAMAESPALSQEMLFLGFVPLPPSTFTLSSPSNNLAGVSHGPTLTWTDADRESTYTVQVALDNTFVSPVYAASGIPADTLSATLPQNTLAGATQYYWRAIAVNTSGQTVASNAPFSFVTVRSVLLIDPPVAYNGIQTPATIYTSGLVQPIQKVTLVGPSAQQVSLSLGAGSQPNQISAVIPSGLATGLWDVNVTDNTGGTATLVQGLQIFASGSLSLSSISPGVVFAGNNTPVVIKAAGGLLLSPRAYLVPTGGGAVTATPLRSLFFVDATTLNATVPSGMSTGSYDLVVVNPDGSAGVLTGVLSVAANPAPLVSLVSPEAIVTGTGSASLTVTGSNFRSGLTAVFSCRSAGTPVTTGFGESTSSVTGTSFTLTVSTASASAGWLCVLRVTNTDGTFLNYEGVGTVSQSLSPVPFAFGPSMTTARRAPALAAGRSAGNLYLYAIGGDNGTKAGALTSVESAAVDQYGNLGAWSAQRNSLPAARAFSGAAAVGSYVYLVGGHDGTGPVTSVLRAQILDPAAAPSFNALAIQQAGGPGLGAGFWFYRLAALFGPSDTSNPSGESLPGETLMVQLPALSGLRVSLAWPVVSGATGYRIYRTPMANQNPAGAQLLAEILNGSTTTFTDDGSLATTTTSPLPVGSLGKWATVAALNIAREGHAVAVAADPSTAGKFYIYAIFGRSSATVATSTYEFLAVNLPAAVSATWTLGANSTASPRADLRAWVVTGKDAGVGTDNWVFMGGGVTGTGTSSTTVEANKVLVGGDLGPLTTTRAFLSSRAGYGSGVFQGIIALFGGANAAASSNTLGAQLCTATTPCSGNVTTPPNLGVWNALSLSLNEARVYMGSTQERSFIFVAGGFNGSSVTNTVEFTAK